MVNHVIVMVYNGFPCLHLGGMLARALWALNVAWLPNIRAPSSRHHTPTITTAPFLFPSFHLQPIFAASPHQPAARPGSLGPYLMAWPRAQLVT